MYLVTIEKKVLGSSFSISPSVEKLQAFSYQLTSKEWSVLDCVPEKGAAFEVHLGGDSPFDGVAESDRDANAVEVICAVIAPNPKKAIFWAGLMLKSMEMYDIDPSLAASLEHVDELGSAVLYVKGTNKPNSFITPSF